MTRQTDNPFLNLDRTNLSTKGFNLFCSVTGIQMPDLAGLHNSIKNADNTSAGIKAHKKIASEHRDILLNTLRDDACITPEARRYDLAAGIICAWVGAEHPIMLDDTLRRTHFTHGQRLNDARVDSGCIAIPDEVTSKRLMPEEDADPCNRLAVVCQELAKGAFDSTRAAAMSGVFAPLVAIIKYADSSGLVKAEMLQTLLNQALQCPSFKTEHPEAYEAASLVMNHCLGSSGKKHLLDKILLSPEEEPRAFALANAIYQPPLKKAALTAVCERLAQHQDKELREQNKDIKVKLPDAYHATGPLAPHFINNAVNGGNTLNMMAGRYHTPIVIPPSKSNRVNTAQQFALAGKVADTFKASLVAIDSDLTNEDRSLVARAAGSVLLGETMRTLLKPSIDAIAKEIGSFKNSFDDLRINSDVREWLESFGGEFFTDSETHLHEYLQDEFLKKVAKMCLRDNQASENHDKPRIQLVIKELLTEAINSAMELQSFQSKFNRFFAHHKQPKDITTRVTAEHIAYMYKGFNRAALERKTLTTDSHINTLASDMVSSQASSESRCNYTDATSAALHLHLNAKNCTLYGGLTAGIPNFTAQHGFVYSVLTANEGIEFKQSLMVLHDINPHFERKWNNIKVTAYRDKKIEDIWSVSAESKIARPFLQAADKPNSKEPLQSTYTADMEVSIIIQLKEHSYFSKTQLQSLLNRVLASRFSGGVITQASISNITDEENKKNSRYHVDNWQIPGGYVLRPVYQAEDMSNLMQRLFAHNLFYKGRRVSEILPDLSIPGVKGAFGFSMIGVKPLTNDFSEITRRTARGLKTLPCYFAEPSFVPVELIHVRQLEGRRLNTSSTDMPWVAYDPETNEHDNSFELMLK